MVDDGKNNTVKKIYKICNLTINPLQDVYPSSSIADISQSEAADIWSFNDMWPAKEMIIKNIQIELSTLQI